MTLSGISEPKPLRSFSSSLNGGRALWRKQRRGPSGSVLVFSQIWPSVAPACAWWRSHFVLNYVAAEMTRASGVLPRGVTTFPYQHKHGVSLPANSSPSASPPPRPSTPGSFLLPSIPPPAPRRHTHCPHGYKHFIEHVAALRSSKPFPALPLAWRL